METTSRGSTPSSPSSGMGNNPSSGMGNNPEGALNKAATGAHSSVDEAARKAKPTIDRVAAMAHQTVDKAAGAAAPAADWLSEHSESLKATQKKLVEDTCTYVSANPLKAVGIAVVAGFLLSRIVL